MAGDLPAMDAIGSGRHPGDAVALEDSAVCVVAFDALNDLLAYLPRLLRHFPRIMSGEIAREKNVILLLGTMRAERRFAVFLTNQVFSVMVVGGAHRADGRHPEPDDVGIGASGIALEVMVQATLALRQGQVVVGPSEMVHGDVDVSRRLQPFDDRPSMAILASAHGRSTSTIRRCASNRCGM